jgi:hypothetical protein
MGLHKEIKTAAKVNAVIAGVSQVAALVDQVLKLVP